MEVGGFTFLHNFDSANLDYVEAISPCSITYDNTFSSDSVLRCDHEFQCWIRPDCAGTQFENNNRTWFYFGFTGPFPGQTVRINIMNMNRQCKLYAQGMRCVYAVRECTSNPHSVDDYSDDSLLSWKRVTAPHYYKTLETNFILSFSMALPPSVGQVTFVAFTYPYTYTRLQNYLNSLDRQYSVVKCNELGLYYTRELLATSPGGRRVDLLTITSCKNIDLDILPREDVIHQTELDSCSRPLRFPSRQTVVFSARVHPGETPASHVMAGVIRYLLGPSTKAANLLSRYVFKIVPMLNPDGVVVGHYRTNLQGVNLNRVYAAPCPRLHPEIAALRALVCYHAHVHHPVSPCHSPSHLRPADQEMEIESNDKMSHTECDNFHISQSSSSNRLFLYLDMHAHVSKRGCFIYGNFFPNEDQMLECMFYPKLVSIATRNFDFQACNFTEKNMLMKNKRDGLSKEGSARVSLHRITQLIQCYTLECNYNTGFVSHVPYNVQTVTSTQPYTPAHYNEVGFGLLNALYDMSVDQNVSDLRFSNYQNLAGVKAWLRRYISVSGVCKQSHERTVSPGSNSNNPSPVDYHMFLDMGFDFSRDNRTNRISNSATSKRFDHLQVTDACSSFTAGFPKCENISVSSHSRNSDSFHNSQELFSRNVFRDRIDKRDKRMDTNQVMKRKTGVLRMSMEMLPCAIQSNVVDSDRRRIMRSRSEGPARRICL